MAELVDEELHFCKLFHMAEVYIAQVLKPKDDVDNAIKTIIKSFRLSEGGSFSDIDLNKIEFALAYLYRYGPLGAALVRCRVAQALSECDVLKDIFKQKQLDIVSLGGGPGNDIIGLCSVIHDIKELQCLNITIVDSVKRWASCFNIIDCLVREGSYGKASELYKKINVNTSFLCCKLPGDVNINKKYIKTLQEADLILMAKLWTILPDETKEPLVESIAENMKEDALLLFVDTCYYNYFIHDFDIVYKFEGENYLFSRPVQEVYGSDIALSSKVGIVVFRKKNKSIQSSSEE